LIKEAVDISCKFSVTCCETVGMQESLPRKRFLIVRERTLTTELPYYGSEGEEEDLSSSPIVIVVINC